jgi:hypothetical protein
VEQGAKEAAYNSLCAMCILVSAVNCMCRPPFSPLCDCNDTSNQGYSSVPCMRALCVAAGVLGSNHQHLFCVRLDPAVDDHEGGKALVVAEVNAEPLPWGPDNPHGECLFRVLCLACLCRYTCATYTVGI